MKKYLFLMSAAAVLLWSPGVSPAFDPGSWIRHGLMALDSRADATFRKEKKSVSHSHHGSTASRVKGYFKSGKKKK